MQDCKPSRPTLEPQRGPPGKDGTVTEEHIKAITLAIMEAIKSDPDMKGPKGDPGPPADMEQLKQELLVAIKSDPRFNVDYDLMAAEILKRLPPIDVRTVLIGEDGKWYVHDENQVRLGEKLNLHYKMIEQKAAGESAK